MSYYDPKGCPICGGDGVYDVTFTSGETVTRQCSDCRNGLARNASLGAIPPSDEVADTARMQAWADIRDELDNEPVKETLAKQQQREDILLASAVIGVFLIFVILAVKFL